jgi:hypothetical protein
MSQEINQRHLKNQIEITDLIAEAIVNASARRNQVSDAKDSLSDLSDEEEKAINGGFLNTDPATMGYFPVDLF